MNKYLILFQDLKKQYGIDIDDPIANELEQFLGAVSNDNDARTLITEAGLNILEFMQNSEKESLRAKDIAEGMNLPSRKISGAMRKLVTENFVEKYGKNPIIYNLSDKGKSFDINDYKERLNNEETYAE